QNSALVASLLDGAGTQAQAPPRAPAPRQRRAPTGAPENWLSADITFWGLGLRYERNLNENFSLGGTFFGGAWLGFDSESLNAGGLMTARWFPPIQLPFYIELGAGFGLLERWGWDWYSNWGDYHFGFILGPALGLRLDVGRTGGFFINPFLGFVTGGGLVIFRGGIGLGGAW
ncbi:MAG: hypothetical protein FWD88_07395, partial [Treponema sp.]|nr:hypothetical protein [Treponema sp.]